MMRRLDAVLRVLVTPVLLLLVAVPFLFPDPAAWDIATRVAVLIMLAASFDLVLGQARLLSFAHGLCFALGGLGMAFAMRHLPAAGEASVVSLLAGLGRSAVAVALLGGLVALITLRAGAIVFTVSTLVLACAAAVLSASLPAALPALDAATVPRPPTFGPGFALTDRPLPAVDLPRLWATFGGGTDAGSAWAADLSATGELLAYYVVIGGMLAALAGLSRLAASPLGRRLQALALNPVQAEAMGVEPRRVQTVAVAVGAGVAALAGALQGFWTGRAGTAEGLGPDLLVIILLIALIGGIGSLRGGVIAAVIYGLAEVPLRAMLAAAPATGADLPPLAAALLTPERWPFWIALMLLIAALLLPGGRSGVSRRHRTAARRDG